MGRWGKEQSLYLLIGPQMRNPAAGDQPRYEDCYIRYSKLGPGSGLPAKRLKSLVMSRSVAFL
ncbi:hypothetical protein, partial [Bacillus cereus group sp. Bce026]|uniref:hypothetical protein n=1 Tax=Bacillus cereus group sp. Bce026 TaxID=3445242 RepID=UPI003F699598